MSDLPRNELRILDVLDDSPNNDSLDLFLRNMAKFDRDFCDAINSGVEFTLLLEVSGSGGRVNWCRVRPDTFDRMPTNGAKTPAVQPRGPSIRK